MKTKIKFIVTMLFTMSAFFLIADEMLYNSTFTAVEPSEKMKSVFEKSNIKFSGTVFPRFWTLSSKNDELHNNVEFEGKFIFKNASQMILAIRNYRITLDKFQSEKNYRAELRCSGEGSVTFGFYRYRKDHKFIGNTVVETLELQSKDKQVVFTFPMKVIPEETIEVAPYFILNGDMTVSSTSMKPSSENSPILK